MIRLRYDSDTGECDLELADGILSEADPLETAILVSLFTDRRVLAGEVPDGVALGGWWGEALVARPGDSEGSRLWTLPVIGRADALTARQAEGHAREALAWLLEDAICQSVTATAAVVADGVIALSIRAVTADGAEVSLALEVT